MNKETASRAALTSSLNISFFVQPTEESPLFFFFRSPFDGLDGSIELIGLVASLPLPVVTAPAIAYHVKLQSMIVQVLGRTVSLVSDIPGDLAGYLPDSQKA